MIELCHLQKAYPNSTPLKDVCVTINKGDVIAVIGPSGCGKSTLLRCINMLDPPTGGNILVDGEDITAHGYDLNRLRRKIGMIFQSFNLFSHQSVVENVMRPQMKLLGRSKQDAYDKAYDLLSVMGLSRQHTRQPMLQQDLEEFVRQIQTNGVMDDLKSYWFSGFDPDNCVVDRSGITGENGTVAFAVENAYEPFS